MRYIIRFLMVLGLSLGLWTSPAFAALDWQPVAGPFGGDVRYTAASSEC